MREVSGDLAKVKTHYNLYIAQLNEYNNKLHNDTQKHYEAYILDLKNKARGQFSALESQHKRQKQRLEEQLATKEAEMEQLRDETASRISTFQDNIRKLKQEHALRESSLALQHKQREACLEVLAQLVHEVDERNMNEAYSTSLAAIKERQASLSRDLQYQREELSIANQQLQDELCMSAGLAASMTIEHIIHSIEAQHHKREENALMLQIEALKSDISHELRQVEEHHQEMLSNMQRQHEQTLADKTEALVALEQQKSELEQSIERLTSDLSVSEDALNASETSLSALQCEYEKLQDYVAALSAENSAASETFLVQRDKEAVDYVSDLLVRDTEIRVLREEVSRVGSDVETKRCEAEKLRNEIENIHVKLAAEQNATAALHVQISELQANLATSKEEHASRELQLKEQIAELSQHLLTTQTTASPAAPSSTSLHTAVLVTPPTRAAETEVVMIPSPEFEECQSSIDALGTRISELQELLEQKKQDLETQSGLKASTKNEIKLWMKEFEKANGHPPDNEEKATVKDKFIAHKQASNNVQALTGEIDATASEIESLEQQLEELRERLCTLPPTVQQVQQHAPPAVSGEQGDAVVREALAAKERENEELRRVQHELRTATEQLQHDNQRLSELVETIKAEKRTDVIARYEREAEDLTNRVAELQEVISSGRVEKVKLETRIKELTDRIAIADAEIEARDARDKAQLTADEEKRQLQGHIIKQREEIVLKSKVATAGWDACADAEEKLESEVDKAYNKGLAEGRKKGAGDLKQLHSEVEGKEARIVQLLQEITDSKQQYEALVREKDEAVAAAKEAATKEAHLSAQAAGTGNGENASALAAELASAQEDSAMLMDRVDELEKQLEISHRRMELLEQMVATGDSASAHIVAAADYSAVLSRIRSAISEGTKLWKDNKKDECYTLYLNLCTSILSEVPHSLRSALETAITAGKDGPKQRGAVALRKALDSTLKKLQEVCHESIYLLIFNRGPVSSAKYLGHLMAEGALIWRCQPLVIVRKRCASAFRSWMRKRDLERRVQALQRKVGRSPQ